MSILTKSPTRDTGASAVDLAIKGMHCAACVGRVEKALASVPGVASASVDLAKGRAHVVLADAKTPSAALTAAVAAAGYEASPEG